MSVGTQLSRLSDVRGHNHLLRNRPHLQRRPNLREFLDLRGNVHLSDRDLRSGGDLQWFRYMQLVGDVR
jgi:hypothetical protein